MSAPRELEIERERLAVLVEAVKLVGGSSWDAPGWNLHIREEYARLLFDIAYQHDAPPRITDGKESRAIRARAALIGKPL